MVTSIWESWPRRERNGGDLVPALPRTWTVLRDRRRLLLSACALLAALGGVVALVLHTRIYATFFFDDSFISLRYADRLRNGHGLTWTDGERVEGYSNLLWVVLVAAGGLVWTDLVGVARALGLVSTSAAVVALAYAFRPRRWTETIGSAFGCLALALSGPVAAWATGGLEASLLIGLVAWALALILRTSDVTPGPRWVLVPALLLGFAAWTRPDGILFAAALAAAVALRRPLRWTAWRDGFWIGFIPALFFGAQTLFRRVYYDAWLPNTSTKLAFTTDRMREGWAYVSRDWQLFTPLLLSAVVGFVLYFFSRTGRRQVICILLPFLAWGFYVVSIGGDFMPQRRHVVPLLLFAAFFAAEAARSLSRRLWPLPWVAAPLLLLHFGRAQTKGHAVDDANNSEWYWQGRPIAEFFRRAFAGSARPLLAVDAAGALPYFWKLPALDMLGLNDAHIARHAPANLGKGALAHELGDGNYVMRRKPDLVVFHLPFGRPEPMWRSGREMVRHVDWKTYRAVYYETPRPRPVRGMVWVRAENGAAGIQRSADRVTIPGYLLADSKENRAVLAPTGVVATYVAPGGELTYSNLPLASGEWIATARASCPSPLVVTVVPHGADQLSTRRATLKLKSSDRKPCFLERVDLVRTAE